MSLISRTVYRYRDSFYYIFISNFYNDSVILYCTYFEDGAPETIAAVRHAGIKVWVLTGDKV